MPPRTGRPPIGESSKDRGYRIRMSDEELKRLDYCSEVLGLPKSEIIRQGIEIMYEKAQSTKK